MAGVREPRRRRDLADALLALQQQHARTFHPALQHVAVHRQAGGLLDSPPAKIQPILDMARAGTLADATAEWLTDKPKARATLGAAVFADPSRFADETIDYYVTPLVSTPLRRAQYHAFHVALSPNPLAGIEAGLKRSQVPVRIVWGAADDIFDQGDAEYLDRTFPNSRGIRRVPGAKLFFQEEFPDVIAEEARALWGV